MKIRQFSVVAISILAKILLGQLCWDLEESEEGLCFINQPVLFHNRWGHGGGQPLALFPSHLVIEPLVSESYLKSYFPPCWFTGFHFTI